MSNELKEILVEDTTTPSQATDILDIARKLEQTPTIESKVFTDTDLAKVAELEKKIDVNDIDNIVELKREIMSNINSNSDKILQMTKTNKSEELSNLLTTAKVEIAGLNEDPKGIFGFFKNKGKKLLVENTTKLDTISGNLSSLRENFIERSLDLQEDIAVLEKISEENLAMQKNLAITVQALENNYRKEVVEKYAVRKEEMKNVTDVQVLNEFKKYENNLINVYRELTNMNLARVDLALMSPQLDMTIESNELIIKNIDDFFTFRFPTLKQKIATGIFQQKTTEANRAMGALQDMERKITLMTAKTSAENLQQAYNQLNDGFRQMETYEEAASYIVGAISAIDLMVQKQIVDMDEINRKAVDLQQNLATVQANSKKIDVAKVKAIQEK